MLVFNSYGQPVTGYWEKSLLTAPWQTQGPEGFQQGSYFVFLPAVSLSTLTMLRHPNEGLPQDAETPRAALGVPTYSLTSGMPRTQNSQPRLAAPTGQELAPEQTTAGWSSACLVFQEEECNGTLKKKKSLPSRLWISCSNIPFTLLPGNRSPARDRICATSVSSCKTLSNFHHRQVYTQFGLQGGFQPCSNPDVRGVEGSTSPLGTWHRRQRS